MTIIGSVLGKAVIEVAPDLTGFASKLSKDVGEAVDKTTSANSGAFSKLADVGQKAFLGLSAGAIGFGAVAIKAALEGQESQAQLVNAVKNTGVNFEQMAPKIDKLTEGFHKFGYENDAAEGALTRLVQITGNTKQSMDLMATAANLAAARHMDLTTAANLVGKAAEGQVTPLKKLGISIDTTGTAAEVGARAIAAINDKMGGAAQAQANTYAGKMNALHAELGNITERVGNALLPILANLAETLAKVVDWFDRHRVAAIALGVVIGGTLATVIGAYIISSVAAAAATIAKAASFFTASTAADALATSEEAAGVAADSMLGPIALVIAGVAALALGVYEAYEHVGWFHDAVDATASFLKEKVLPVIQDVSNWLHDHWKPVLEIIAGLLFTLLTGGVGPLIVGLVLLYEKFGIVHDIVNTVAHVLVDVLKGAFETVKLVVDNTVESVKLVIRIVTDLVDIVVDIFTGRWGDAWKHFKDIPAAIIDYVKGIVGNFLEYFAKVPGLILDAVGDLTKLLFSVGRDIIAGLVNGVIAGGSAIVNWAAGFPAWYVSTLGDVGRWLLNTGADIIHGLVDGIVAGGAAIVSWAVGFPQWFRERLGDAGRWIWNFGYAVIVGMVEGIKAAGAAIVNWVVGFPPWFVGLLGRGVDWLWHFGRDVIDGFVQGIRSMGDAVIDAILDIAGPLAGIVKKVFHIGSPSKVFFDIGQNLVLGLAEGIKDTRPVNVAMDKLVGAVGGGIGIPSMNLAFTGAGSYPSPGSYPSAGAFSGLGVGSSSATVVNVAINNPVIQDIATAGAVVQIARMEITAAMEQVNRATTAKGPNLF